MLIVLSCVDYFNIVNYLTVILQFQRLLQWQVLQYRTIWPQLFQMTSSLLTLMLDWIYLVYLYQKLLKLRNKKKCWLVLPHMLLQILAGYRANSHTRDVWELLENNWNNFFWLTGETPNTLQLVVDQIERNFYPYVNRGRKTKLDLWNQVSMTFSFGPVFCTEVGNTHSHGIFASTNRVFHTVYCVGQEYLCAWLIIFIQPLVDQCMLYSN